MSSFRKSRSRTSQNSRIALRTVTYLSDAAIRRNLLLEGPSRKSSVLKTPVRFQPVDVDDLPRAIKLHQKGKHRLHEYFAGKRRVYIGLGERLRALERLRKQKERKFRNEELTIETTISKYSRRKSLKSFNSIEDMQAGIPTLFLISKYRVDLFTSRARKITESLDIVRLSAKLIGNQDEEIRKLSHSLNQVERELAFWKQRMTNLGEAGKDTKVYRSYRNASNEFKVEFTNLERRLLRLHAQEKTNPELITKWIIAGFNFYASEIDRLTYELKILHKLDLHFVGRNERKIVSDLDYARARKAEFKKII